MPYSLEEMQREMDGAGRMSGEGFLFSIFPSETVRTNMLTGGVDASVAEVERLWTAYQKGASAGIAPYSKERGGAVAAPWLQFLEKETGYSRMLIAAFLNALEKAVKKQGWDWKWLDPVAAREAGIPLTAGESITGVLKQSGKAAAAFFKPVSDPVTNIVKYAAVALVAGAVIYGVYHGTKIFKVARTARRGRKN